MKKAIYIFLFFYSFIANGQVKRFIYEYEFISDSTQSKNISKEIMFLDIIGGKSEFYGYQKFQIDSTIVADTQKGLFSMPPNKDFVDYRVKKNITANDINLIVKIGPYLYDVSDERKQDWKISDETDNVLGYFVQKAELNFAGRKWTAWFSKDIPLQDGPYKFYGLPGLILKIQDSTKSHSFIIKGVLSLNENEITYPQGNNKIIKINETDYKKLYTEYRNDPVKNLRGRMPDQTDENGNFISGEQALKRSEAAFKKRINADNNVIELDLLKK
ncbi:GLPGLI family protein [Chryseobacterium camelliae]|uniref:GLPGLI family protein n=1 Tax=Chryseobacterium camelliae TaxID=1265445 RepID=UPI002859BD4C|nr:GLPGLI family protein [Chryseobacterium camelliae]MDR6517295.1 GLPGLI family protein [Chryseobacterium camelliae]